MQSLDRCLLDDRAPAQRHVDDLLLQLVDDCTMIVGEFGKLPEILQQEAVELLLSGKERHEVKEVVEPACDSIPP